MKFKDFGEQMKFDARTDLMFNIRVGWCCIIITGNARRGYSVTISNPGRTVPTLDEKDKKTYSDYAQAFAYFADCISAMNTAFAAA